MNSILHLTYLHFAAGAWRRWFLLAGAGAGAVASCLYYLPTGERGTYLPAVAFAGVTALFIGSSLMPMIVSRVGRSHLSYVLPASGLKLLASAFLTTALVSLPLPVMIALALIRIDPNYRLSMFEFTLSGTFVQLYAIFFWACSALYLVHYLFTVARTSRAVIGTMIVVFALASIPQRLFLLTPGIVNPYPLALSGALWTLLAVCLHYRLSWRHVNERLATQRLGQVVSGQVVSGQAISRLSEFGSTSSVRLGREVEWVLGIRSGRVHALSAAMVVVLIMLFIDDPSARLFILVMLSFSAGVTTGIAAANCSALWLRCAKSRDELFATTERLVWYRVGCSLLVAVLWFIASGFYIDMPLEHIAIGAGLIVFVFTVSLYFGLMQTRVMRWTDAGAAMAFGVFSVLVTAYAAGSSANVNLVVAFEVALLAFATMTRHWAKHRWRNLDWMLCRSMRLK